MSRTNLIVIPREVLLVEIDRRCSFPDCNNRMLIGLTKREAASYTGFECEHCQRWTDDELREKDIPDWWSEICVVNQATH
ncbi:MAG: hypothetical protein ACR2LM_09610 [Pyrinomonadaceae bacterium]